MALAGDTVQVQGHRGFWDAGVACTRRLPELSRHAVLAPLPPPIPMSAVTAFPTPHEAYSTQPAALRVYYDAVPLTPFCTPTDYKYYQH